MALEPAVFNALDYLLKAVGDTSTEGEALELRHGIRELADVPDDGTAPAKVSDESGDPRARQAAAHAQLAAAQAAVAEADAAAQAAAAPLPTPPGATPTTADDGQPAGDPAAPPSFEVTPARAAAAAAAEALDEDNLAGLVLADESGEGSPETGSGDDDAAPAAAAVGEAANAAGVAPTREELRQKVRAALAAGDITLEDVVADIYASQYNFERTVTSIVAAMSNSKMFRKMLGRVEKAHGKDAPDGE